MNDGTHEDSMGDSEPNDHSHGNWQAALGLPEAVEPDPEVWAMLRKTAGEHPKPKNTKANIEAVLSCDPRWEGRIRWDEFAHELKFTEEPDPDSNGGPVVRLLQDTDETEIAIWLERVYGMTVATALVSSVIALVARQHRFHPIRDYLNGLDWDGTPRLNDFLPTMFGAEDTELNRAMGRRWLISCVARVMQPGCKVDTTLILVGKQGAGKSTAFQALTGQSEWFSDSHLEIGSKDAYQSIQGVWIYEIGELDSISRREATTVKAFLSAQEDKYRPSYGRNQVQFKRQVVFVGSTNESEFLNDPTGSRRFWPVRAGEVDVAGIRASRDQLWAEAAHLFEQGEQWWLTDHESLLLKAGSDGFETQDAWESLIASWVESDSISGQVSHYSRDNFPMADVLAGALGLDAKSMSKAAQMRAASILRKLGFEKRRTRDEGKVVRYWCRVDP